MADPTTTPTDDEDIHAGSNEEMTASEAPEQVEDAEIVDESPEPVEEPSQEAPHAPQSAPAEPRRGPGVVPLLLGGVVAAGLGYGAAYMGLSTGTAQDDGTAASCQPLPH